MATFPYHPILNYFIMSAVVEVNVQTFLVFAERNSTATACIIN